MLRLAAAIVDAANRGSPNDSGVKVGGHQASSASMVDIMVALWFSTLRGTDRVSVKPHASPVLHGGLLDDLAGEGRAAELPQPAQGPRHRRLLHRVGRHRRHRRAVGGNCPPLHPLTLPDTPEAGRFISLLGDAELDEGAIWEAVADPKVASLGELLWVVDLNRQSLDRVVPDIQIERLRGMFAAAGWQVVTLKWGRFISELFERPGGQELRRRLEEMPNEEYQRMLRVPADEVTGRILAGQRSEALRDLVAGLSTHDLSVAVRDLGGHDLPLLVDICDGADEHRPTVVFAYTIKGRGLSTEGHPINHSALLTEPQMRELAERCGADPTTPWATVDPDSAPGRLCAERAEALQRPATTPTPAVYVPPLLGHPHRKPVSTQAALGRLLTDLVRDAPELAARLVTCSPDVASSTNLGGWINKTGVWSVRERHDWFADDRERVLRWSESESGQHIELGIAEVNLVGLLGELGTTWSRWGQRLIPVATIYDPFVSRALEPWSYGIYAGGQSILVGTPSGITLAPEGGAPPVHHHPLNRIGAARLHRVGTCLRFRP